ncbi:PTS sugar transporter subunit IIA [Brachyspira hyodysenteriae]|uniref:PTS sugar transporter subunit IIA n=1 Tax=Brachyspira hyodysenteriae TaxID=159 RepID=UPI00063DC2C6|nr:PTS sugar transporter subunit IIA [Brachyspira hyodysenteriae]KLI22590.1 PTS sugar transporter subunit IIA [Brachyspira hyodysenteriae]KLI23681.1 PTS sugar transporter subunit IIA [Brachyspira hyodysenteriae]KLI34492.1 PTS sugar transporter subunit IIA [Brachyspira hyodysenteriae]MCZ9886760.1 PTS sugar transporter subunit IIA [Brachyspira hyodysenteriae]TVL74233.1 PTS sugar transporter subunit IIA [Brachyspira hyodysenteriae]
MSFIDKERIFLENTSSSKDELFDFLSEKISELDPSYDAENIKEGLYDREKDGNTVIADMVAMPHARMESIKEIKVTIVSLLKPIEYSPDESIDLAYSIVAPIDANDEFIDVLTLIAMVVQDEELQNIIRNSKVGDEEKIFSMIEDILKLYGGI